jgi:hypothetical protein
MRQPILQHKRLIPCFLQCTIGNQTERCRKQCETRYKTGSQKRCMHISGPENVFHWFCKPLVDTNWNFRAIFIPVFSKRLSWTKRKRENSVKWSGKRKIMFYLTFENRFQYGNNTLLLLCNFKHVCLSSNAFFACFYSFHPSMIFI